LSYGDELFNSQLRLGYRDGQVSHQWSYPEFLEARMEAQFVGMSNNEFAAK
jgi:hypothetical protein